MRVRRWWGGRLGLAGIAVSLVCTGCASLPFSPPAVPAASSEKTTLPEDDDFTQLIAQYHSDLNRYNAREVTRTQILAPSALNAKARDNAFADRARALFTPLSGSALHLPVVGVRANDLDDSWHASRDGGSRVHKGIDIFASRGTPVVAVADGIVSFIGDQRLGGHCVWLSTESGTAFYYAHLDHWAPGLYEGMEVQTGDILGYVGNTGNAIHTPPHLHFAINQNDEMVNPYPLLSRAVPVQRAHLHTQLGGGTYGTR
jgi:peptidoglycan LD-endopeptidase LytH